MEPPTPAGVTSSGLFAHDDPLKHSLLLLLLQIVVILSFSRLISFAFRPLRQPRVVAEIISGILLGPTAFGSIPKFSNAVFPKSSLNVLQTVANFGLIFFLFLVGLELDFDVLRKTGSRAMVIAAAGIVVPFSLGIPVSMQVFKEAGMQHTGEHFGPPFVLFMGVALSITAFPVLARILTERKIMATEVGQIAISAAAVNDVAAWVLLGLAVAVSNSGSSPLAMLWVLIAGLVYLGIMFAIVRPFVRNVVAKKDPVPEFAIAITFLLLLLSSFATDVIGINVIFGAFIMGIIIPKDHPISGVLIEKTEDFVSILLLPLYFTSSGLNVELGSINNGAAVGALLLVTATAAIGKVGSTMIVARLYGLGFRCSAALGFLMSTKGLVELIVLNIGLTKGVINKESFAVMVLMALVTTIATTPMIMWLYKPARDLPLYKRRNLEAKGSAHDRQKLRMLVCLYGMRNVPGMMNLVEMSKGRHSKALFQVNALHLLELSDRLGAVKMAEVVNASEPCSEESDPQGEAPVNGNAVATAMRTFGRVNNIPVKVRRSVSRLSAMHEDICEAAVKSRASIVVLPYHKYARPDGTLQCAGSGFLQVNQRVLAASPCSVAILVDRAASDSELQLPPTQILALFFGGPDDREALWLARRMAEQSSVKLTIIHCTSRDWPRRPSLKLNDARHQERPHGAQSAAPPSELRSEAATPVQSTESISEVPPRNCTTSEPSRSGSTAPPDDDQRCPPAPKHNQLPSSGLREREDVQVAVGPLELQERETSLDERALAHLPERTTVRALAMEALEELLAAGEFGLVIAGLHYSSQLGAAPAAAAEHGLGSIGNWLMSRESVCSRSSLLVVWQHGRVPSRD